MDWLHYTLLATCGVLFFTLIDLRRQRMRFEKREKDLQSDLKTLEKNKAEELDCIRQRIIDIFPRPFFSINGEGTIIRVNSAARKVMGNRELLDRSLSSIFFSRDLLDRIEMERGSTEIGTFMSTFAPGELQSAFAPKQESHWKIDLIPTSLNGDLSEVQLMMLDISQFVYTEQVRRDFVANASHELRTPLSVISGYLEILTDEQPEDEILGTMLQHSQRINRIVDDMLVIARLESESEAPLDFEPFDLRECVEQVLDRLRPVIEERQAKVKVEAPSVEVIADRFYWTQILFNLIENALKHNPDTAKPRVDITVSEKSGDRLKISIKDNGQGIPRNHLPYIFKRFYRVDKQHSRTRVKGTGLGLSIVRRAVEAHHGTIDAKSIPGKSTTFIIEIPKDASAAAAQKPSSDSIEDAFHPNHQLLPE